LRPKISPKPRKFKTLWNQIVVIESPLISENPLTFKYLNFHGVVQHQKDWNSSHHQKLWLYNLHYHDFLLSPIDTSLKHKIIHQWMKQNPWPQGVGWEPYPLSLRIVNWIKYFLSGVHPDACELQSLYLQCYSLDKQIEYHLLGNHLFENAKALFFAGVYFQTKSSQKWFKKGMSLLKEQLKEQILEDGGHFERSPMYHAIILQGVLDLYQLCLIAKKPLDLEMKNEVHDLQQSLYLLIPKMLRWLMCLTHQDGRIAFFNDSTFGVAPSPSDLYLYAESLGFNMPSEMGDLVYLENSGFCRAESKEALILADIGSIGPSYIPGHAHAETLSFEASLKGKRLFVNTGISTYVSGQERLYQRGTLAHNTVAIDGNDSSHVWSSFRVAERAVVYDIEIQDQGASLHISASHDGYKRLKYGLIHKREWNLSERHIVIKDSLLGGGVPDVVVSFHIHPHWSILSQDQKVINLISDEVHHCVQVAFPQEAQLYVESYDYACGFNKKKKGICIRACISNRELPYSLQTEVKW